MNCIALLHFSTLLTRKKRGPVKRHVGAVAEKGFICRIQHNHRYRHGHIQP